MRKAVSLFLSALLVCSTFVPAFAQESKKAAGTNVKQPSSTTYGEVRALTDGNGVLLKWQMAVETNNYGFFVYRLGATGKERVSESKFVEGSEMRPGEKVRYNTEYSFFDTHGSIGTAYVIEGLAVDGSRLASPVVVAQPVADLKAISGTSGIDLARNAEASNWDLERSELLVTKKLSKAIEGAQQLPNLDVHKQVVASPAVRINVKRTGVYRVSRSQLESAGFNVNGDPNNWQLFADGVEQGILIGPNADYIEFYGRGISTSETDNRVYFLINGAAPGKRMQQLAAPDANGVNIQPNFPQTFVKEIRVNYTDKVINGDAENYWGNAIANFSSTSITFNLSGIDYDVAEANFNLRIQGYSDGAHTIQIVLNGHALESLTGTDRESFSNDYVFPTTHLLNGNNTIELRSIASSSDFNLFDTMRISFAKKYEAANGSLTFYTPNGSGARLSGFSTPNVRVFETTFDSDPILMTNLPFVAAGLGFGAEIPGGRGRAFLAVEESALMAPVSVTPNDPAMLGVPSHSADLVIISYKDFLAESEIWANYRRAQGYTVKVVEVSEIFDEFSYGSLSSNSIKSFLQYAVENWQTPPRYVLLMGDASYDSRNYEGMGFYNFVPTKSVNTIFSETVSDEALADFNNDGLAELAIGRIPARTSQMINTIFAKTVNWETSLMTDPLSRGALFASDFPNGYNFEAMSGRIRDRLPADMPKTMVFRGEPDANATLVNHINAGKYIVNYAGHGTTGSWGGNPMFFNVTSVAPLTNANNESLFTMLTCLNGYFHNIWNESFAEVLTKAPNGGAVAAWASSGLTTPDVQEVLAGRFYQSIGLGTIPRLGDVIRDAKSAVPGGSDVRYSWVLIGDPLLKVR